jgi:signal transduction histidine kinase/DNA-binding LacI/PurR family transcriptional regulator
MDKRPIVGLMVNDLVGSYQYGHWLGLDAQAAAAGCDLISFNGGEVGSPDVTKRMRNEAFRLVNPQDVDALVLMAPAVANSLTPEQILAFVQNLSPLPLVIAGMEIPGTASVMVDNSVGMESVVEHVVGQHERRRPVFLGGPVRNPEAIERKAAFRAVLERHGIESDPELELVAEFDFGLGRQRIAELLERKIPFDAVIAANDEMALGAMEALKAAGLRIPDDVVVTGFDDIEDALFSTPALTSVRQPVVEQGRTCLRLALDLLAGKAVPRITLQAASLVVRGSCGCHSYSIEEGRPHQGCAREGCELGSPEHLAAVETAVNSLGTGLKGTTELDALVSAISTDSNGGSGEASLRSFGALLDSNMEFDEDSDRWQILVSRLRKASLPFLQQHSSKTLALEGLLHQLRMVAHERVVQRSAYKSLQIERWTRQLQETGGHLITSFDVRNLVESLASDLPRLQLKSCHLLLREKADPADKKTQDDFRLILSYSRGARAPLPPEGRVVRLQGFLRQLVQESPVRAALAMEPLFFEETPLGFALMELAPLRGVLLDALRTQISAALMGERLAREVRARTLELENALDTLRRNQSQLVHSEKMASLGKLTAGIAHEMNTPLAAVRGSVEELKKLVEEYRESIGDPEVEEKDHREIAADMLKSLDIASRASEKAAGFVRSIKSQTRDMGAKDKQVFDLVRVVEEAVLLLSHSLRSAKCEVRLDFRSRPASVLGIPDRFAQVVTNLVTNAVDAMESKGGGIVTVSVQAEPSEVLVLVSDQGSGIPPELLERIFDPLFTTKPVGKGTGLGLTIIHDIVQGDFGGRIEVESTPGSGTTFTVRLPPVVEA